AVTVRVGPSLPRRERRIKMCPANKRGRRKHQGRLPRLIEREHKSMGRKIAIVGAGAVGGYTGAHMVQAGEDVTFIDPWPAHVEEMRKHGLRVIHAMDVPEFKVLVRALHVTDAQQLAKEKPIDIAFICMKSYDTAWAATL